MTGFAAFALAATLATDPAAAAADREPRTVSVRIHDYAGLHDGEIFDAEKRVSAIYAGIGVELLWRLPVCPDQARQGLVEWPIDPPASLTIMIVPSERARGVGAHGDVAGYAPVSPEFKGRLVFVVADRTEAIALRAGVPHAWVLARVMAHELAHVFMPERAHSHRGIMRAQWRPAEFRDWMPNAFSPDEAAEIRSAARALGASVLPADH